jgi:hypothetical protein
VVAHEVQLLRLELGLRQRLLQRLLGAPGGRRCCSPADGGCGARQHRKLVLLRERRLGGHQVGQQPVRPGDLGRQAGGQHQRVLLLRQLLGAGGCRQLLRAPGGRGGALGVASALAVAAVAARGGRGAVARWEGCEEAGCSERLTSGRHETFGGAGPLQGQPSNEQQVRKIRPASAAVTHT